MNSSGSQAGEQEAPSLFGCPANVDKEGTEVVYAGVAERGLSTPSRSFGRSAMIGGEG